MLKNHQFHHKHHIHLRPELQDTVLLIKRLLLLIILMKIKILGTRGEIKASLPEHANHSGVLIDSVILLDVGEKKFLDYYPKYIFTTHLHPDHAYFVRRGIVEATEVVDFTIFAPEGYKDFANVKVLSGETILDSYKITPVPTHHSKLVQSQSYIIEKDGEKLLYTGDVVLIDKKYYPLFNGLDLVITDGSYIRKGGLILKDKTTGRIYGHTGIPNLIDMYKEYTQDILFIHFGGWFFENPQKSIKQLEELGSENGVNVIAGYDGMEIDLQHLP